jgi:ribonuclease HI
MHTEQIETTTKTVDGSPISAPNIVIYADGSSLKNGAPDAQSGAGAVLIDDERGHIKLKACYLGALTNQQAEIMACTIGLEDLKNPSRVKIFSDSKYVVDTMLGVNRMKSNRPYWNRLVKACYRHHITWSWVRGHSGNVFQETADRLSRAAATAKASLEKDTLERLARLLKGKPDEETIRMIHNGLKAVATVCDGAQMLDNQGFNKLDSAIGHGFAGKKQLDQNEAIAARKLLATYRSQVAVIDGRLVLLL